MRVCSECCLIWKLNRIYKSWWAVQTTASVFTGLFRLLTITAIRTRTLPFWPAVGVPEIAVWRIARNAQRAPIDRCVCNLCIANWFSIACEFTRELKQTNKCGENKKKKKHRTNRNIGNKIFSEKFHCNCSSIRFVRRFDVLSVFFSISFFLAFLLFSFGRVRRSFRQNRRKH